MRINESNANLANMQIQAKFNIRISVDSHKFANSYHIKFMNKLRIKKGDQVKILTGKDKGKTGKVLQVLPEENRAVVEGLNIRVRFSKPRKAGEKGQRLELPAPINRGKLMLICPHCGKPTRHAAEVLETGNFRKCKKCGKLIS